MSHELRTPLNAILGMSEVLSLAVYGPLTAEQQNAVNHIEESGRHLLNLINDILDISKIEAGKVELEFSTVAIGDVCQASLRLVKQQALHKNIKADLTLDDAIQIFWADERRLKQMLVNLLNNAVKFTPAGGAVGLSVSYDQAQESIHFTVWDTGIGISPENLSRLFQPFVQIDSSLSRHHEGTGLGLSLVARLAELHGGGVSVESEVGQGSRFTVSLPAQSQPLSQNLASSGAQAIVAPPMAAKGTPLILLAEDNEANIITVRDFLQASGYRVIVGRNGHEAIARASEDHPQLILMDIQLPALDGLEAIRRLRADPATISTPIIALTALAMPGDRERCLAAGANEYMSKPVSLSKLLGVIEAQLQLR